MTQGGGDQPGDEGKRPAGAPGAAGPDEVASPAGAAEPAQEAASGAAADAAKAAEPGAAGATDQAAAPTEPAASGAPDGPAQSAAPANAAAQTKPAADAAAQTKPAAEAAAQAKPAAKPAKPAAKPAAAVDPDDAKPAAAAKSAAAKPAAPVLPKAPPWWRALRAEPPAHLRAAMGLAMVAFVIALWWFVTRGQAELRIISPSRLPSPGEVIGEIGPLSRRDLVDSIIDTLERVFYGVGLAAIVGVTAGVLASAYRGIGAVLNPLVIFLRSVPMGALFPLTLLLFSEHRQKTMFLFLAIVAFVFSDTVKAMMSVPERFVETAQTLGASRFQIIRKVLVPLALPDIVTSLRFQFGLALGYVMLAEEYNTRYGLGQMINMSQRLGQTEPVYLLLFLIALLAFGIDLILRTIQRGVFAWRKDL